MGMLDIDELIDNTSDIQNCLVIFKKILESGNCNTCLIRKDCEMIPKLGELVRYNCFHYKGLNMKGGSNDRKNDAVQGSDDASAEH